MPYTSTQVVAAEKLKRMFSLSATFQSATGGTVAQAAAHVYLDSFPDLKNQALYPRPLAILMFEDAIFSLIAGGNQNQLRERGMIRWVILRNSSLADPSAAAVESMDFFSNVLTEIALQANEDDPLSPYGESHLGAVRIDRDDFGRYPEEYTTSLGALYGISGVLTWGDEERFRGN